MASLWLAPLLLAPGFSALLLLGDPGMSLPEPGPPIRNVRMDPESKRLTWDLRHNVSGIRCFEDARFERRAQNNLYCQFYVLPKCQGSNYTVQVTLTDGGLYSTWIEYPTPEGDPGVAAKDLSCEVHDRDFLTCRWAVGRRAPRHVQYHFHLEDTNTSQRWGCPSYTLNARGQRTQCRFDNVSAFSDQNQLRFLVAGAGRSPVVPCAELIRYLSDVEKLVAPALSATCNRTLALVRWEMSSHFHSLFDYELEIQQGTDPPFLQKVADGRSFALTNPRTFTARVRAQVRSDLVGQWSDPRRFECDQEAGVRLQVWLSAALVALGTLVTAGTAVFLGRRYSVLKTLFPPIPRLKDPIGGHVESERMFTFEAGRPTPEECPVAEVQILKEP